MRAGAQHFLQNCVCAQRRLRSTCASAQSGKSSLPAWRRFAFLTTHRMSCEESGQTARVRGPIWVFAMQTCSLVGNDHIWNVYFVAIALNNACFKQNMLIVFSYFSTKTCCRYSIEARRFYWIPTACFHTEIRKLFIAILYSFIQSYATDEVSVYSIEWRIIPQ